MDFLDKIGNIAKNIGDRTNDAIEITKLNAKISSEKNAAAEELNKIGDFIIKNLQERNPSTQKSRISALPPPHIMRRLSRQRLRSSG